MNSKPLAMDDFSKTVVARADGRDVTQGELSEAFNWVANKEHWKRAIDCTLVLTPGKQALVAEAVPFFTGSRATIEQAGKPGENMVRVRAAGYYATIGA